MKKITDGYQLSASDLIGHLNCWHLSVLDRAIADGALQRPKAWDPLLEILRERGAAHERAFVEHLKNHGIKAANVEGVEVTPSAVAETLAAMKGGVPVIVQAALAHDRWAGRADNPRRRSNHRALQRSGIHDSASIARRPRRDRRQISGSGGAHRDLLHG
jgi:uncharacterized protein